ncbi:unnamed protein product, partial [Ectocarpus sp. 13 AM-2016]
IVYATSVDGSVVHATATGTPPGGLEDRTIDPGSLTRRTLLEANPRCMLKVEELRDEDMEEREEAEKAAVEGRSLNKGGLVDVNYGERRIAGTHESPHLTSTESHEVSVDGSIVLRKSGPSWFGFRKKDSTYEVRMTEDGVAVSRGGKYDWGIQARKPLAQVVPTTICICDKCPDV